MPFGFYWSSQPSFDEFQSEIEAFYQENYAQLGSRSIHKIVGEFVHFFPEILSIIESSNKRQLSNLKQLADKIELLSEKKCTFYRGSWLGFFYRFFSSLNNAITLCTYPASSGQLGLDLANRLKAEIKHKEVEAIQDEEEFLIDDLFVHEESEIIEELNELIVLSGDPPLQYLDSEGLSYDIHDIEQDALYQDDQGLFYTVDLNDHGKVERFYDCEGDLSNDSVEEKQVEVKLEKLEITNQVGEIQLQNNPKEAALDTFKNIWKHAGELEKVYFQAIWNAILKGANVESWEKGEESNQYILKLDKEIEGRSERIPGFGVLKKEIVFSFSEKLVDGVDGTYQQVVEITNGGFVQRFNGWVPTPDVEATKMILRADGEYAPIVIVGTGKWGKTATEINTGNADEFIDLFNKINWT